MATSTQAIKLKFEHKKIGDRLMCIIQTRIRAQGDQLLDQVDQLHEQVDQLREQVDKVIDYLIYQRIEQKVEKKKVYEIIKSRSFLEFIPSSVLLKS